MKQLTICFTKAVSSCVVETQPTNRLTHWGYMSAIGSD